MLGVYEAPTVFDYNFFKTLTARCIAYAYSI